MRTKHGWLYFKDWGAPDPHDERLGESLHTLRYNLAGATQTDAYRVLAAAEAYCHFAGHPTSTKNILDQLRELRRRVRDIDILDSEEKKGATPE